jgi:hypothetical protein
MEPAWKQRIEATLGRPLEARDLVPIDKLGHISQAQLDVLRHLAADSYRTGMAYIAEICSVERGLIAHFVEDVGTNGQAPLEWEYRDLLCLPERAMDYRCLVMTCDEVLAPLASLEGLLVRFAADRRRWQTGQLYTCPSRIARDVDRTWERPPGTTTFVNPERHWAMETVTDPVIDVRRSMAALAAWRLFDRWQQAADVATLIEWLALPAPVSEDGRAALTGLLREASMVGDHVPGYGGPSSDYE